MIEAISLTDTVLDDDADIEHAWYQSLQNQEDAPQPREASELSLAPELLDKSLDQGDDNDLGMITPESTPAISTRSADQALLDPASLQLSEPITTSPEP